MNNSIWPIHGTIPGQRKPGSIDMEDVFCIPNVPVVEHHHYMQFRVKSLDETSYLTTKMLSAYATAPADKGLMRSGILSILISTHTTQVCVIYTKIIIVFLTLVYVSENGSVSPNQMVKFPCTRTKSYKMIW